MQSVHRITKTIAVPDIEWIEVPEGKFKYQTKWLKTSLKGFYISKYPITNSQYQTFIDDQGYENSQWWTDLQTTTPQASKWPHPNRPKTHVNWYEAIAFTRWLSFRLGYQVALPTEQQWEKAARGGQGNEYPWGKFKSGYANIDDKSKGGDYLEQTTAVGVYPQGNTPTGVADLSGNVWEWCLNKLDSSEVIKVDTSGDSRVLRGGSWIHNPDFARADWRYRLGPGGRYYGCGFRIVCALPTTGH